MIDDAHAMAEAPQLEAAMQSELEMRSLREILEYSEREGFPQASVMFEARLVFAGPKRSWFCVQDGKEAVRVTCQWAVSEKIAKLKQGCLIRIRGKTVLGRRDIALESYDVIDPVGRLEATPIWANSPEHPLSNYSFAEMEGVVKEIHVGPHGSNFLVQSGIISFRVDVDQVRPAAPSLNLLDRIVKFQGAIAPATNQRNVNYFLHCMDYEHIEPQSAAPPKDLSDRKVTVLYSDHMDLIIAEDQGHVSPVGTSFAQYLNPGDEISIFVDRMFDAAKFKTPASVGVVYHSNGRLPPGIPMKVDELLSANLLPSRVVVTGRLVHSARSQFA